MHKKSLFLTPRGAHNIYIYHINTNKFEMVRLKKPKVCKDNSYIEWLKFSSSAIVGNSIYFIPRTYPAIVEMNILTYELIYYEQWLNELKGKIFENEAFFWSQYIIHEDKLILASANSNMLLYFDTKLKVFKQLYCGNEKKGYSGIVQWGENILLTDRKSGQLEIWDPSQKSVKKFQSMPPDFKTKKVIGFSKLISNEGYIYAIPLWANMLLKISLRDKKVITIVNYDEERNGSEEIAVCCAWIWNKELYCLNNLSSRIDIIGEDDNYINSMYLSFSPHFIDQMEKAILNKDCSIWEESPIIDVSAYIRYVFSREKDRKEKIY